MYHPFTSLPTMRLPTWPVRNAADAEDSSLQSAVFLAVLSTLPHSGQVISGESPMTQTRPNILLDSSVKRAFRLCQQQTTNVGDVING